MMLQHTFEGVLLTYAIGSWIHAGCLVAGLLRHRPSPVARPAASARLLIPAWNTSAFTQSMQATIAASAQAGIPVVIVDDGSDAEQARVLDTLTHQAGVQLQRHRRNPGKVAALITGMAGPAAELLITADADTTIGARDLRHGLAAFAEPGLGALAIRITAAPDGVLAWLQAAEYAFILDFERHALAGLGIVFTVPGAAAFWRRAALVQIGGFFARTLAEDTDATLALQGAGWTVQVTATVTAETRTLDRLAVLLRQRRRWVWGNVQAACCHGATAWHQLRRSPALAFVAFTALQVLGFVLAVWMPLFLMTGSVSAVAAAAVAAPVLAGALRLMVAIALRGSLRQVPAILAAALEPV